MQEIPDIRHTGSGSAASEAPASNLNKESIFSGPDGVWPVWRVLVYVSAYYLLRWVLILVASAIAEKTDNTNPLWLLLIEEGLLLAAALAPAWALAKLEMRPFSDFGLPLRAESGSKFLAGLAWGIAALTLLLVVMHGIGVFDFGKLATHGVRAFKFASFWAVFFLLVALYEDFLFRGYSLITLSEATGFWPAAILISALFGATHLLLNRGETLVGATGAAGVGLFFCFTLRRTGTLWFAVGMHAAWDWGETFLYSVPDSGVVFRGHLLNSSFHGTRWLTGGSVGPEGSILVFALLLVMWVGFDRVYPAKSQKR